MTSFYAFSTVSRQNEKEPLRDQLISLIGKFNVTSPLTCELGANEHYRPVLEITLAISLIA